MNCSGWHCHTPKNDLKPLPSLKTFQFIFRRQKKTQFLLVFMGRIYNFINTSSIIFLSWSLFLRILIFIPKEIWFWIKIKQIYLYSLQLSQSETWTFNSGIVIELIKYFVSNKQPNVLVVALLKEAWFIELWRNPIVLKHTFWSSFHIFSKRSQWSINYDFFIIKK